MNAGTWLPFSRPMAEIKQQAFVDLISEHQGILHKVSKMYCDDDELRRDLFQEMLLQLWKAFPRYEGRSKISTWMYRIALNTAISSFRKQKKKEQEEELGEVALAIPFEVEDREQEEKKAFLYRAIQQLSEIEKGIVMLHLEDHSYEEIAEIIGITRNHVGVKLNRIKAKLAKMVVPYFDES
ncbi:MAG: sigma-70 family RNA polymerase sigma factor [Bacteroidota bacterium]